MWPVYPLICTHMNPHAVHRPLRARAHHDAPPYSHPFHDPRRQQGFDVPRAGELQPRAHLQHGPDRGRLAARGEDAANVANCLDSWAQVIRPGPEPHELHGGTVPPSTDNPTSPQIGSDAGRSCRRAVSPSTSALLKLTEPDSEPPPDPRLAPTDSKLGLATNSKKTPSWYRRVSVPRNDACSPRQIKALKLQLEIAKEKNKGELCLGQNNLLVMYFKKHKHVSCACDCSPCV